MEFELKQLPLDTIESALDKADHYRLLNDPAEAESVCLDVLEVDPENQHALVTLLLSLTDQFDTHRRRVYEDARAVAERVKDPYKRTYYSGIIFERRAKTALERGTPGCGHDAFEWFEDAMAAYEDAEKLRPAGANDPLLRWNSCARWIQRHNLEPRPVEDRHELLD